MRVLQQRYTRGFSKTPGVTGLRCWWYSGQEEKRKFPEFPAIQSCICLKTTIQLGPYTACIGTAQFMEIKRDSYDRSNLHEGITASSEHSGYQEQR